MLVTTEAPSFINDPTPEQSMDSLVDILDAVPQQDGKGGLRWLLACGWSVELFMGAQNMTPDRESHKDLDLVVLDKLAELPPIQNGIIVEKKVPENFYGGISLRPEFLQSTAQRLTFLHSDTLRSVHVVHPAVTLAQKCAAFGNYQPRDKDSGDVDDLMAYRFRNGHHMDWQAIIDEVLAQQQEPIRSQFAWKLDQTYARFGYSPLYAE